MIGISSIILCLTSCMAVPFAIIGAGALGLAGTTTLLQHQKSKPELTPLEIQTIQTREYNAPKSLVFATVTSVFQDLGYTISHANEKSGFIKAKAILKNSNHVNVIAFVQTEKNKTKVRLSFIKRHRESATDSLQLLDATLYQNIFERIESNLFIHSNH